MTQEAWDRYRKAGLRTVQSINSLRLLIALKWARSRSPHFSTKVIERIARIDQRGVEVPGAKIEMAERHEEVQTADEGQRILVMLDLLQWVIRTWWRLQYQVVLHNHQAATCRTHLKWCLLVLLRWCSHLVWCHRHLARALECLRCIPCQVLLVASLLVPWPCSHLAPLLFHQPLVAEDPDPVAPTQPNHSLLWSFQPPPQCLLLSRSWTNSPTWSPNKPVNSKTITSKCISPCKTTKSGTFKTNNKMAWFLPTLTKKQQLQPHSLKKTQIQVLSKALTQTLESTRLIWISLIPLHSAMILTRITFKGIRKSSAGLMRWEMKRMKS